jgi:antitoxin VapB
MKIVDTHTFKSGNSEAVRLPKGMGFGIGAPVQLIEHGDTVTIRRSRPRMTGKQLVEALEKLPKPDGVQEREPIEFPERPGL